MAIAIDACFRLKRRAVSSEEKDPILGSGWGYFVEDTGFKAVLSEYGDQEEVRARHCSLRCSFYLPLFSDVKLRGPVGD